MADMPIPHWITRTNKRFANPLVLRLSSRMPPFATIRHRGGGAVGHSRRPSWRSANRYRPRCAWWSR
ncbi:hypothetical protein NKG05_01600 [Oerskovia sp. M15]